MSANLRRLKHENVTAKFDANRGAEGQIKARKNAKGEVELVAFFGGKWFYCPMAEFNKTLNLRHGAQVNGSDIMTANQKDSSGFSSIRLDATSSELGPKLNECKIFVDTIAATSDFTENCATISTDKTLLTVVTVGEANIKVGLNVSGSGIPSGSYITGINASGSAGPKNFEISLAATATDGSVGAGGPSLTFGTADNSYPNAFLNILYKDGADTYYHKFQLNTTTLTPFYDESDQVSNAGSAGGAGGSGNNLVL